MSEFPYARLRRWPDVEADELQAHDATDLLLAERALDLAATQDIAGADIAVIGDAYGAIALRLAAEGLHGLRVHQDLVTGRRALARNAEAVGIRVSASDDQDETTPLGPGGSPHAGRARDGQGTPAIVQHELAPALLDGARLVLLQLPKALAELEEIADAAARWAAPDVVLVAGGRVKHMTLGQNQMLSRRFRHVQPQRAERKSRLVIASEPLRPLPAARFPVQAHHRELGLTLVAHGGAFAGARLDIGTRVLLDVLGLLPPATARSPLTGLAATAEPPGPVRADTVVDLGCGTGALAAAHALAHPEARVVATDRSAAAVASARGTMAANRVANRVRVMHDDAASALPDGSADLVLLNPPFHLGTSVHAGAATRLFEAAARVLRPGGELWTVYNSGLGHRAQLARAVGPTEQRRRTPKFTVTRSIRR